MHDIYSKEQMQNIQTNMYHTAHNKFLICLPCMPISWIAQSRST